MSKIALLFLLFLSTISFSQLTKENSIQLRQLLQERVNELRASKSLPPLGLNDTLQKAAEIHSVYMAENEELTHDEKKARYATPSKRVKSQKGKKLDAIGENVAQSGPYEFPLNKRQLTIIADALFTSWEDSPGHFANMTNPEYTLGDFGFSVNPTTSIIYATQVFAKYGIDVPGQLSRNNFGITEAPEECDETYESFSNLVMSMGNALEINDDEVLIYHHDIAFFNRLFTQANDGIAVDLVSRDQLLCSGPNQLDFSPIYDGILLKPVFRQEMLDENRAESDYRLITRAAEIPSQLKGNQYSPSLILLKNGKKCKYLIPIYVPAENYEPTPLKLKLDIPENVHLSEEGIVSSQTLTYDFKTSDIGAVDLPKITKRSEKVHSVKIHSYSSVEGDSAKNQQLHQNRAQTIKSHLLSNLAIPTNAVSIDAKENWELMNFQLNYFSREDFAELSHDSLKNILASDDDQLPWDSLLFAQRRATATIHYLGKYNSVSSKESLAEFNLRTAVALNNPELANLALYTLFEQDLAQPELLFDPVIYEYFTEHPECVANYAAVLSKAVHQNPYQVTSFLFSWLKRGNELTMNAKFNLLHLYSITAIYLLDHWDVSSERLSNVIHPKKVDVLAKDQTSNELLLNVHLAFIEYYGQINDKAGIGSSFYFIADHFKKSATSSEEVVKLALFFNSWSMYPMTIELLESKYAERKLSEDELFVLLHTKTMSLKDLTEDNEEYLKLHQEASHKYTTRWCEWLDADFQILRNHKVKQIYCEKCN